jgi:tetratricopeptide (TPR) repeat protein
MIVEYGKGRYFQDAAKTARRALALNPALPDSYFLAIKSLQDAGDYPGAFPIAAEAVKRFPTEARAHFEYGFHLQKLGRVEESLQHLRRAMELDPSYEEPRFFYGDLLLKQSKHEESVSYLESAIRIRNDYLPARLDLARALMALKRWEEASRVLEETIKIDPKHPQPRLLLSQLYFRRGDEKRAQEEKEISLRLRRENPALLEAPQSRPFEP